MKQQTSKSLLPHWGSQLYSTDLLSAREFYNKKIRDKTSVVPRIRGHARVRGGRRPRKAGNARGVGTRGDGHASKVGENGGLRFHSSMIPPAGRGQARGYIQRVVRYQRLREGKRKNPNGDVALFVARQRLAVVQYRQLTAG